MARILVGFTALIIAFVALSSGPARAGTYKDDKLGFKVSYPAKWDEIPVKLEERWIVARFLSQKEYRYTEDGGWSSTFKPEMRVIIFPDAATTPKEEEIEVGGATVVFRNLSNPYKNYEDYLQRTYSGGGWFISKKEEKKTRDLDWTLIEIKVEKLARSGKKRIVAGVFHAADADYVVQIEVLEETYRKLKGTMYRTLSSFALIARKGSIAPETTESSGVKRTSDKELTPKERHARRVARQKRSFEKLKERLPRGWSTFSYKSYFHVISHVDKKYALMVCRHGENVWKWLDKNLPYVGDETPRPIIIRICANPEEERAYHGAGGNIWFVSSGSEVVMSKGDLSMFGGSPFGELNSRILSNWMNDKDPGLSWAMPSWLRWGLDQLVDAAWTVKSGRLKFAPDRGDRVRLAIAHRNRELRKIQEVLTLSRDEIGDGYHAQMSSIVRFLLESPLGRSGAGKKFLPLYIGAAKEYVKERDEKRMESAGNREPRKEPETEEEEEEMLKERRNQRNDWEARELEHLREIFNRAFKDWSEKDWRGLEARYRKYLVGK